MIPPTPSQRLHGTEFYNDATHDSTVDTDGKNREAERAAYGTLPPDQMTTSNASLVNAMPETPDGFAGFDSRQGGNHPRIALRAGYVLIDMGFDPEMDSPLSNRNSAESLREFEHRSSTRQRPARVIKLVPQS